MDYHELKNSVKLHTKIETLRIQIINQIQGIPSYEKLKNDVELVAYISNVVYESLKDMKEEDKENFIVDTFVTIFQLSNDEVTALRKIISFLLENGHIKPLPFLAKLLKKTVLFIKKRV